MADPDARPIRKGKLRQPTEFGYVIQLAELTENTRRGARGLIRPGRHPDRLARRVGPARRPPAADMDRLGLRPRELALDGGFFPSGVAEHLPGVRSVPSSPAARAPARDAPTGAWRGTGSAARAASATSSAATDYADHACKGHQGARTWVAWAILAYNLDTLAIRGA